MWVPPRVWLEAIVFAALNVVEGKVIGRCMQRHRHQEFIRFLNTIEAETPAGKIIHMILDNYGTHSTQGASLARSASALGVPLHADLGFTAERDRGLLCKAHQATPQTRRLQIAR